MLELGFEDTSQTGTDTPPQGHQMPYNSRTNKGTPMTFIKSTLDKIIIRIGSALFGNALKKSMEQYDWAKENLLMTKPTHHDIKITLIVK